ncbi:MerR family transcriptional regulator [Marinicrinis sediminis]|uniref:MerR family transcriptional regulator n=1 Tax=Marinicrinis sediminis TaxID=1652465 RepID=A0ABW5R5E8_9BACL
MTKKKTYRMGQLSEWIGISKDTIRHWEKKGLLKAERSANQYHVFSDEDYYELYRINLMRSLGFSLDEIREWLHTHDAKSRKASFQSRIQLLEAEIQTKTHQRNKLLKACEMEKITPFQYKMVQKTFKLKALEAKPRSQYTILDTEQEQLVYLSSFDGESDESAENEKETTYFEVEQDEDFIYPVRTFIHFHCPKAAFTFTNIEERDSEVLDDAKWPYTVQTFASQHRLTLTGEMIEVHDLKQLLFDDHTDVELFVAVHENKPCPASPST